MIDQEKQQEETFKKNPSDIDRHRAIGSYLDAQTSVVKDTDGTMTTIHHSSMGKSTEVLCPKNEGKKKTFTLTHAIETWDQALFEEWFDETQNTLEGSE